MIRRNLRDAAQLNNMPALRRGLSYLYLGVFAIGTLVANFVWRQQAVSRSDNFFEVLYLVLAVIVLSSIDVRIERGRLNLASIALGTAAILLNPVDATLVGLSLGISMARRGLWPLLGNSVMAAAYECLSALIATNFRVSGALTLGPRILVLIAVNIAGWVLIALGLSLRTGESILSIVRHNFTPPFYAAYAYFALAALLTSYVLDGSLLGYLLATIVFVLALALTDTIAGRRVRRVLESELSDADRHLFHSRAVEGVVHNLRNHMATAIGYLKEIDPRRLDPIDREAIETATAAANDAVTVLRTLSQGATPRVSYAAEPIELNELVSRALGMARPRARSKEVELGLRESPEAVKVRADPLLLREVITNLINNAIDAAPAHGHVELTTGRRNNGWLFFSVADNGPGVSDDNRHHLFEPHFTTKETGTGLGLFMSYGIVREHQGQLTYNGSSRGAVFTVTLPPFTG
ncbi:MAG: HAMP domain-containing histidine kinase [Chloroflexi bacterium]|nr:MAG: HAMP domain-containing histidine kinase [Chloroflexota bacterium]TME03226.1 MAG: HAMP domain-containing histidine kinase [Chloroflexota bacterium]